MSKTESDLSAQILTCLKKGPKRFEEICSELHIRPNTVFGGGRVNYEIIALMLNNKITYSNLNDTFTYSEVTT